MSNESGTPKAGGPSKPAARPRPTAAPRPKAGGKMWSPEDEEKPPAAPSAEAPRPLPMHKLSDGEPDAQAAETGSATTFFAIPQAKRKKVEEPPAPPTASSASAPAVPPPAAPGGSAAAWPAYPGPMVMQQGIQGPVASGPMVGMSYPPGMMPMPPGGLTAPPPDDAGGRAQSFRVFAIVLGLMFLVLMGVLVSAALIVGGVLYQQSEAETQQPVAAAPAAKPAPSRGKRDTAAAASPKPVASAPKPKPKPSGGGGGTSGSAPAPVAPKPAAPPPPPPAPVGPAPVSVTLLGDVGYTAIEITCPNSGFRGRGEISGGKAVVDNVPREECDMKFKGGAPASNKIAGGQNKTCTFPPGGGADCK